MSFLPAISDLDAVLLKLDATMEAAESHGALCGILCAQGSTELSDWLDHVLGEQEQGNASLKEAVQLLSEVHRVTIEQLNDAVGEFSLLLPDDDDTLSERTEALSAWCQGYVYGLAAGGVSQNSELPADTQEIIKDFIEISRIGHDDEASESFEEDEIAYMEIMEYVRMGTLLINEELQPLKTSRTLQ